MIKKVCIICREQKDSFNEEHIILDTIGGDLKIRSVCTDCNSFLSKKFNVPFLEDTNISIFRKSLELSRKGRKRNIKSPAKTNVKLVGDDDDNFYLKFTNVNFTTIRKPEKPIITEGKDVLHVSIKGNPDDLDKKMIEVLRKYDFTKEEITNIKVEKKSIPLQIQYETNPSPIIAEGLKVAYEFAVSVLPEYFQDEWAIKVSKYLETGVMSNELSDRINGVGNLNESWQIDYEYLEKYPKYMHLILLKSYKGVGLFCIVKLFHYYTFHHLSDNSYLDEGDYACALNNSLLRRCILLTS